MDNSSKDLLEEAIVNELSRIDVLDGDEKKEAISNVSTLYKLKLEEEKIELDSEEEYSKCLMEKENHKQDMEMRREELQEAKQNRWFNAGIAIGTSLLGIVAYDLWFRKGLKFEETGTVTSPMIRNLVSKMLPNKK